MLRTGITGLNDDVKGCIYYVKIQDRVPEEELGDIQQSELPTWKNGMITREE
jgi:hypothetical protein